MSLLGALFRRKPAEAPFDPNPEFTDRVPVRPYRVLHADLPFYSDKDCRTEVQGARLVVLHCEDPRQRQRTIECMPVLKNYRKGQTVCWELNNKNIWEEAWYINPDTGVSEQAWVMAVEFCGKVVEIGTEPSAAGTEGH